jgi:hypothetical protein
MSLENKIILARGRKLAVFIKTEFGDKVLLRSRIVELCRKEEFAKVILSSASTIEDKIKIIYAAYLHIIGYSPEKITKLINMLYFVIINFYDSDVYPKETCDDCGGDGFQDCYYCEGSAEVDCQSCDGDGTIECDGCGGDGTEECRYCDGKGTETEEDDEGNEIEVECVHCDGSGEQKCRDCGGYGNFECPTCDGRGKEECIRCDNTGQDCCENCGCSGEVESDDKVYEITTRHYISIGRQIEKYNGQIMSIEKYEELDSQDKLMIFETSLYYRTVEDNRTQEERNEITGMDDYFAEIVDVQKLESMPKNNYGL